MIKGCSCDFPTADLEKNLSITPTGAYSAILYNEDMVISYIDNTDLNSHMKVFDSTGTLSSTKAVHDNTSHDYDNVRSCIVDTDKILIIS